jgi:hypothetical protein
METPTRTMQTRTLLAGFAALAMTGVTGGAAADPRAVVELFTSQGCSSCPPADKVLGELADRDDVLALSYNIDYWDYLGWKDTLASHDFSDRQRAYATARGDRQVYTPQMVVNGGEHVVGSNRPAVEAAITRASGKLSVPVDLSVKSDAIEVKIGASASPDAKGTIWLVMYDSAVSVPIERGENRGETVTYHNVVRKVRPIAMWKGEAMTVDLPRSEQTHAGTKHCAVILQAETAAGDPGPILGVGISPK